MQKHDHPRGKPRWGAAHPRGKPRWGAARPNRRDHGRIPKRSYTVGYKEIVRLRCRIRNLTAKVRQLRTMLAAAKRGCES